MAIIGIIAILAGICGFMVSSTIVSKDKALRNGSVFIALGGMVGGVFATPSRGYPNGFPGAAIVCFALIAVGVVMIVKSFKKPNSDQEKNKKANPNTPLFIAAGIFLALFVLAFATSGGSSSSSEPWRELGVSKKEYMEVYNYFKYGNP